MQLSLSLSLLLTTLLTNVVECQNQCGSVQVRKEIRDMSVQERQNFIDAIKSLNAKGASRPTVYDNMVQIHVDNNAQIHSDPVFLVWHRHYIHYFQSLLRKNYPNVVMPYWDWARDSQAPERSEIFSPEYFGSTGLASTNYCIKDGPFRQGEFDVLTSDRGPNLHCLARNFDKGEKLSAFSNPSSIERLKTSNQNYDDFAGRLELMPHALPHNYIGNNYGDMSTMSSPNDPIFWLHHGMVDKMWADWQILKGKEIGLKYHSQRSVNDALPYFSDVKVGDVLDTTQYPYCYVYAGQPIPDINKPQPSANVTSSAPVQPTPTSSSLATSSSSVVILPSSSVPVVPSSSAPFVPSPPAPSAPSSIVQVMPSSSSVVATPAVSLNPPAPISSSHQPEPQPQPSQPIVDPVEPSNPGRPSRPSRPNRPSGGGFFITPEMLQKILESIGIRLNRRSYKTEDDQTEPKYPAYNPPKYPTEKPKYPTEKPKYPVETKPKYPTQKPPSIITIIHDGMNLALDVANLLSPKAVLKELNRLCPITVCPQSDDRSNLYKLRVPEPIKEEWIRMNRLSVEKFRIMELENAQYTYQLNKDDSFISDAALGKRWVKEEPKQPIKQEPEEPTKEQPKYDEEVEVIKKEKVYRKVNVREVVHY